MCEKARKREGEPGMLGMRPGFLYFSFQGLFAIGQEELVKLVSGESSLKPVH